MRPYNWLRTRIRLQNYLPSKQSMLQFPLASLSFLKESYVESPLLCAETYLNRYKNGWVASTQASKQFYDECARRKGRPNAGAVPILPFSEMPVPVPISRFFWPQVAFSSRPCTPCQHLAFVGNARPKRKLISTVLGKQYQNFVMCTKADVSRYGAQKGSPVFLS